MSGNLTTQSNTLPESQSHPLSSEVLSLLASPSKYSLSVVDCGWKDLETHLCRSSLLPEPRANPLEVILATSSYQSEPRSNPHPTQDPFSLRWISPSSACVILRIAAC